MSTSEAERFANDLKTDAGLRDDLRKSVAGLGLTGIAEYAKQKGYSIDVEDAKAYIQAKAEQDLSDEQLDRIAGGKSPDISSVTTIVAVVAEGLGGIGTGTGSGTAAATASTVVI